MRRETMHVVMHVACKKKKSEQALALGCHWAKFGLIWAFVWWIEK